MTAPRTTRELLMPEETPRTTMICRRPCPAMDMIVSKSSSPGNDIQASTNLCTARSSFPPINPAVPPISTATTTCSVVAARPTNNERRAPVDEPAQEVPPELVGAQGIHTRWAGQPIGQLHLIGIMPGQGPGKDADQNQQQQDNASERPQGLLLYQSLE